MKAPDYFFYGLAAILLFILVFSVSRPVPDPYVELYFEDFESLPETSGGSLLFSYAIHNAYPQEHEIEVRIILEYFQDGAIVSTERELRRVAAPPGEVTIIREQLNLTTPFEQVRVSVSLPTERIHFWVRYEGNDVTYPGFGPARLDCVVPQNGVGSVDGLVFSARATYGNGWPIVTIVHNGRRIGSVPITSATSQTYVVPLSPTRGDNPVDILYEDDYYNDSGDAVVDRNVLIEEVRIGTRIIKPDNFVIEFGLPHEWFDCRRVVRGSGSLTGPGALRLRFS